MYVQLPTASTDIYVATQNCIQNRASLQNCLPTNSKARSLRTSLQLQIISTMILELYTNSLKHIQQFIFIQHFFVNLLTEELWVQRHEILCLLEIQTRLLFLSLHKTKMSKSIYSSNKLSLTHEGHFNHQQSVVMLPFALCLWEQGIPNNFQNKSVSSSFKLLSM